MAVNGSEWINNPWDTTFSPFTDFFQSIAGHGSLFWFVPLTVLTLGVYYKTENPISTTLFMIVSGSTFAMGNVFTGHPQAAALFTIFTALGITAMFTILLLQRR